MTMELKPCPFCGGRVVFIKSHVVGEGGGIYHADSSGCGVRFESISDDRNEEIVAAWNQRKEP